MSSDRKNDRHQDGDNQGDGQDDDQDAVLDDSRREQRKGNDRTGSEGILTKLVQDQVDESNEGFTGRGGEPGVGCVRVCV